MRIATHKCPSRVTSIAAITQSASLRGVAAVSPNCHTWEVAVVCKIHHSPLRAQCNASTSKSGKGISSDQLPSKSATKMRLWEKLRSGSRQLRKATALPFGEHRGIV
ncbi:hypothetical protein HRbin17_02818 [bacterium HR17]|uniref:Uncharacterized protein n=1 Tax=Candidatus Fervidibacter japonicus TaxID=2035412 RepID=A0A2H5XGG6_9BACT|nr:hypothetical protein HRbin17_02818 [bacterium HR17]